MQAGSSPKNKVAVVASIAKNGVIGRDGLLPWNIPKDLARFKEITMGGVVIAGKVTAESMGELQGREVFVVSRPEKTVYDGVKYAISKQKNAYIVGGEQVFSEGLEIADYLYLTRVKSCFYGDRFFPFFDLDDWELEYQELVFPDNKNLWAIEFITYHRVDSGVGCNHFW